MLPVRLTEREKNALGRICAARGVRRADLVRGWIEAADVGMLQPVQQPAPVSLRVDKGLAVDGSLAGRAAWLVALVEQVGVLPLASLVKGFGALGPSAARHAARAVARAAADVRDVLDGVEPSRPCVAEVLDELVVRKDIAGLEEASREIQDALDVVRRRTAAEARRGGAVPPRGGDHEDSERPARRGGAVPPR